MTRKKTSSSNPDQLSLFNVGQYERNITEASIDAEGEEPFWDTHSRSKSTPVATKTVQRVYFWVEEYLMRQRYLHYRFCCIHERDGISQVVKIHIPGQSRSVREGRVAMVKEAIAAGTPPDEIETLIRGWRASP